MNENADCEEQNSIGEFEIARLIKECLGRYDTISNAMDMKYHNYLVTWVVRIRPQILKTTMRMFQT